MCIRLASVFDIELDLIMERDNRARLGDVLWIHVLYCIPGKEDFKLRQFRVSGTSNCTISTKIALIKPALEEMDIATEEKER